MNGVKSSKRMSTIPPPRPPPPLLNNKKRQSLDLHAAYSFAESVANGQQTQNANEVDLDVLKERPRSAQKWNAEKPNENGESESGEGHSKRPEADRGPKPTPLPRAAAKQRPITVQRSLPLYNALQFNKQLNKIKSNSRQILLTSLLIKSRSILPESPIYQEPPNVVFRQKFAHHQQQSLDSPAQQSTGVNFRQPKIKEKPVAPPRLKAKTPDTHVQKDEATASAPNGPIHLEPNNVTESDGEKNGFLELVDWSSVEDSVQKFERNASTDSSVEDSAQKSLRQRRPSIEAPTAPLEPLRIDHQRPVDPLRLAPERASLRRQLKSVLTPPLPRPLFPAPAPPTPPRVRQLVQVQEELNGTKENKQNGEMSIGNLFLDDTRQNILGRPPLPAHPPPSSQSFSLDLNKLPLRFADDNDEEHRQRKKQLQETMSASPMVNHFDFDEEDDDSLDLIRLSVLQTNSSFDADSKLDESGELNDEQNDGERFCFFGWVKLIVSTKKQRRCWLTLRGDEIAFYEDDTQDSPFIGPIQMEQVRFVGLIKEQIHIVAKDKTSADKNPAVEYKFVPEDNGSFWLQMLTKASCQSQKVLRSNIQSSSAGGQLWLKQTISDEWAQGWAFVTDRRLQYWIPSLEALFELDLRKTMQIKKELNREYWCEKVQRSEHGAMLLTLDGSCLYMQADSDICTLLWYDFLIELFQSASKIDEYCMTTDNVPILVDKCIRFIQTHGMELKGIYRKNGSASEARSLMSDFTNDPFNFHIMRVNDETSNVAADVLRAFFRQLMEPLIPIEFHKNLYQIADVPNPDPRIEAYRCKLAQFPTVNFNTIRRLMSHLAEIAEHSSKNLASIDNLAKIFGPTVFGTNKSKETDLSALASIRDIPGQIKVVKDLLTYFKDIFPLTSREIVAKEKIEELQSKKIIPKARANGFLVPIHLFEKENKSFNVQSYWHASQVIDFKRDQLKESGEDFALFEVHAQGKLERRVASDEVLSHIVLDRWMEWRTAFTDSYLIIKKDSEKIDAMKTNAFADDVKYAEQGSKTFKSVHFKLESGTRVVCYSKAMKPLAKWNLSQTIWFVGSTDERKAPNPNTLTFFVVQGPDKQKIKNKLSGSCIAFHDKEQRTQWLNCIIICKRECQAP
ncbi:Rho-GAP domain-containing protein [Aphelenchoides bicaudatus]|nr:Rho-GAP domain-containing protein [Aphelenchoides bicaudatus]